MPNRTKILLIDESRENIKTLCEIIASNDVDIFSFTSLEEAIASLATQDYGLAILDMKLPAIGDVEQMKVIRAKQNDHLPIIFVTDQQNNDQTVLQGYETGAIDLLFRPLNHFIVRSKVRVFVELHRQRRQMQFHMKEVEDLRVAAEAATVAKSQFLANMSHEIRTPLAAVMGFADLIARGSVPPQEMEECSNSIQRNGAQLMRIIDDILDLSKIEANRIEMEIKPNLLEETLNDIDSTLSLKAREKSLQLYFNKRVDSKQCYNFDPVRLKQILYNIIGNAIKFTTMPHGHVLVNMQIGKVSDTLDRISFTVKNEGVGFTAEQAERLFQPFGQADASIKREYGGSGLGLVISRQLARAMGGDIIVLKSEVDVGTEIEISMVLERGKKTNEADITQKSKSPTAVEKELKNKKILIVDDARDNLVLLQMFLRGTEAELTLATNGLEAYELCKTHTYDMILMDIQMPKMDGHEATRAIRLLGQKMPIIALTAHGTKNEHEKSRLAGCSESITKPFSQPNLLKTLISYLN